jgi:hypothetical protein
VRCRHFSELFRSSGCNLDVFKGAVGDEWCDSPPHCHHADVADKQGSGFQTCPMQEHYLPSAPIFLGL